VEQARASGASRQPRSSRATGAQGPQAAPGSAAVSIWANVANNGVVIAGEGLSVQHVSTGTSLVTVTDPACSRELNRPVASVSDGAPGMLSSREFPVALYEAAANQFTVFTDDVSNPGGFTSADRTFDIFDTCP
jgi:hypothetical protein